MKHILALLIKFTVIGTVLFSILSVFYNASLIEIFFITAVTTAIAYFAGDLVLLPKFGNAIAIIGDFLLAFGSIGLLSYVFIEPTWRILLASFFAALAISAVEALFHVFMLKRVLNKAEESNEFIPNINKRRFAEEFSEEPNAFGKERKQINPERDNK